MIAQKRKINWNNPVYLDRETAAQHGVAAAYPGKGYGSQRLFDLRNRNHGTLTNGPAWTTGKFGEPAISYNGSSTYTTLGTSYSPLVGDFTLSMWLNANAWKSTNGNYDGLLCKRSGFATMSFEFYNNGNDGQPQGLAFGWGNSLAANWYTGVVPSAGAWHHVALTRLGSVFTLYVDGASAATTTNATAVPTGSDQVVFGVLASDLVGGTAYHFNGKIGPTAICNKANAATQIAELYRNPFLLYWQPSPRKLFFFRQTTAVRRQAKAASKVRRLVLRR